MRARNSILTLATAILVAATSAGGAQSTAKADPLFRLLPRLRAQIEPIRDSARALGLPDSAIVNKALEGDAKKADPKYIVAQVQKLFTNMRVAQRSLATNDPNQITAGADALFAGLTADELEKNFRTPAGGRSPASALTFLSSLVSQLGVPRAAAVPEFAQLWRGGASDETLRTLWKNTQTAIINGVSPSQAFTTQVKLVPRQGRGGGPDEKDKLP